MGTASGNRSPAPHSPGGLGALAIPGLDLREELGRGVNSVVYRAVRGSTEYAVKVLEHRRDSDSARASKRFFREAAVLASLTAPGLATIHAVGEVDGRAYLVKEYIDGDTLASVLRNRGPMPQPELVRLASVLARALSAVHRRGLIHRDVKPRNVLIDGDGGVKLIDFGFVTRVGEDTGNEVGGTFQYSAPEQTGMLKRAVDGRADLYALGVLLYECAAGAPPFVADDAGELVRQHAVMAPPPLSDRSALSRGLAAAIHKLLAKDPDDRYQTAAGLVADLDDLFALDARVGNPSALGRRDDPAAGAGPVQLAGRDTELSELTRLLSERRGALLWCEGATGSGKSQLLTEMAHAAGDVGAVVMRAQCVPDAARPFAPLASGIEGYLAGLERLPEDRRELETAAMRKIVGTWGGWLGRLSPALARLCDAAPTNADDIDLGTAHGPFYDVVAEFLVALAEHRAVVVTIDDAHWLDPATADVLGRVSELVLDSRLVIALGVDGSARPNDNTEHPVWSGLRHHDATTHLPLAPLTTPQVTQIVTAMLGGRPIDPAFATDVAARCNGNPLAVAEFVNAMLDHGVLQPDWDGWTVDRAALRKLALPSDVVDLLVRRIDTLSPHTRELLQIAAVRGASFDDDELAALAGVDDIEAELVEATRQRLLLSRAGGRHAFVHDSARNALIDELSSGRRRALHQRIAEHLDAADDLEIDDIYAKAQHYARGDVAAAPRQAYAANAAAGRAALEHCAREEALAFLAAAHDIANVHQIGIDPVFEEALGIACVQNGFSARALRHLETALEHTDDPIRRAEVRIRRAEAHLGNVETKRARRELERGLADVGAPLWRFAPFEIVATVCSWLLALVIGWTRIGFGTARGSKRQRLQIRAEIYELLGLTAYFESETLRMTLMALRPLLPARRIGRSRQLSNCYANYACFLAMLKARRASQAYSRESVAIARELGDATLVGKALLYQAVATHLSGDCLLAEQLSQNLLEGEGRALEPGEYINGSADLTWNKLMRGHFREGWYWIENALTKNRHAVSGFSDADAVAYAAGLRAMLGHAREARELLERFAAECEHSSDRYRLSDLYTFRLLVHYAAGNIGDDIDDTIESFKSLGYSPRLTTFHGRHFYVFQAYARLAQCRAASGDELTRRMRQLRDANRLLNAAANVPVLESHYLVLTAAYDRLRGRHRRALATLATAEALAQDVDNPWVLMETAAERALIYRDLGNAPAMSRAARDAIVLAADTGWTVRAHELRDGFEIDSSVSIASNSFVALAREDSHDSLKLRRQLDAMLDLSLAWANLLDPRDQARVALDEIARMLGAERAFLFLIGDGGFELAAGRDAAGDDLDVTAGFSTTALDKVRALREPLVVTGSDAGPVAGSESVVAYDLRSIAAAPLLVRDELRGVLYLDSRLAKGVFSTDDLGVLVALGTHIAINLEAARTAQLEVERTGLAKDLAVTGAVQSMFLPRVPKFETSWLALSGYYEPAASCGGDWWNYTSLPNGNVRVFVGDVTGHGAGAAMVTATVASTYQTALRVNPDMPVDELLAHFHDTLRDMCRGEYRMTTLVLEFDADTRELTWWNAGAPPFLYTGSKGGLELGQSRSAPLGGDELCVRRDQIRLGPGARVFAFTDGIPETNIAARNRPLGYRRLSYLLTEATDRPLYDVATHLARELADLRDSPVPTDDVTFVTIDLA